MIAKYFTDFCCSARIDDEDRLPPVKEEDDAMQQKEGNIQSF